MCHRVQLGVYLRAYSDCSWERLESLLVSISQAGWECAIESNWEVQSSRLGVCNRVQLGVYVRAHTAAWNEVHPAACFQVRCIQRTKSHAYHSNVVNA